MAWLLTIVSVVAVSALSLVGLGALSLDQGRLRRASSWLISFAVGSLLGDVFLHLLPEAFGRRGATTRTSLLVLGGILAFFVVEKLLRRREASPGLPSLAAINLVGDGVHNLLDGALIAASYLVSPTLGVSTTLAVLAHELPQELGDFGVLVHSGLSPRRAVWLNLATASVALVGALLLIVLGRVAGTGLATALIPATAGGFVYLALADLVPELQRDRSLRALTVQVVLIGAGIGAMAILTLVG